MATSRKTYEVKYTITATATYVVEADSEEAADEAASLAFDPEAVILHGEVKEANEHVAQFGGGVPATVEQMSLSWTSDDVEVREQA